MLFMNHLLLNHKHGNLFIFTASAMLLLFFVDIFIPLGVALGVLYILSLLILLPVQEKQFIYFFAVFSSLLTITAFVINLDTKTGWMVYANRLISLLAIWITALLIVRYNERLKEAEKDLVRYTRQIESKNKELEQFAYIASHDLQEPLRTVTSFTELLSKNYSQHFDEKGKKSMNFITEATTRMSQLIKGLLDYSLIGRNSELVNVDCGELLKQLKGDLYSLIDDTKTTLEIGKMPVVKGNPAELRLLFQNLISNAIKFRRTDELPQVSVSAEQENGYWKFTVSDNGIGIGEEYRDRVFIIYQRLHDRTQYEGTGIGLAHCRKIVELHGGEIWFDSKTGEGSTFYFTIPS